VADNYGTDVQLGADGLNPQFPLISGHRVVGYNFFRRITTPSNLPAYKGNSVDITAYAGAKLDPANLPTAERDIIRVAVFEERISTVLPTITLDQRAERLKVSVRIALVTGEVFTLVLTLSSTTAQVINATIL